MEATWRYVHKLKGTASYVGATDLVRACEVMRQLPPERYAPPLVVVELVLMSFPCTPDESPMCTWIAHGHGHLMKLPYAPCRYADGLNALKAALDATRAALEVAVAADTEPVAG